MDPSEEKNQDTLPPDTKRSDKRSNLVPAILIVLLLATITGIAFYFFSGSQPPLPTPVASESSVDDTTIQPVKNGIEEKQQEPEDLSQTTSTTEAPPPINDEPALSNFDSVSPEKEAAPGDHSAPPPPSPVINQVAVPTRPQTIKKVSVCDKPALQLHEFYSHLDGQPYMAEYKLPTSSEKHFSALIQKLLANPPQVTRESDDLYTILKNTAHFFRISGKDNILMLKGILDNEKSRVELILSDYYLLVTTPECSTTPFVADIDRDALYEYACFFLNTMGGRLYLFRRDSLSRMVVTYYAILLVEQANIHTNNRHGIALRPMIDMLIAEMEAGGSTLQHSTSYLDSLYDLKEKYQ